MALVVKSTENGETTVRFAETVKHLPKHIDGAPILLVDMAAYWTGQHDVLTEHGAVVFSVDLGASDEAKREAEKRFMERVYPRPKAPTTWPSKAKWLGY